MHVLDSMMIDSSILHPSRPQHDAADLLCISVVIPTGQATTPWHDQWPNPPFLHLNTSPHDRSPTTAYVMVIIDTDCPLLPGPRNSLLWWSIHPLTGIWPLTQLCLSAHSKVIQGVQQSTHKVYRHAQHNSSNSAIAMASCPFPQIKRHFCTLLHSWLMPKASSMGLLLVTYIGYGCYTSTWACQTHSKVPFSCINISGPYTFSIKQSLAGWSSCMTCWYWPAPYTSFLHSKSCGLPWPWLILDSFGQVNSQ